MFEGEPFMDDSYIRKVNSGDAAILTYIQTESWKEAFKNIISSDLLARCTETDRVKKMYDKLLEHKTGNGYILEVHGEPHCIAWWDATREHSMTGYAELICIHSLPNNWRNGYGNKMLDRILDDIQKSGYQKVMLWVFTENRRARKFYERKGFVPTETVQTALGANEMMYVYDFI